MHQIWFARSTAKPRRRYGKSCALDRTLTLVRPTTRSPHRCPQPPVLAEMDASDSAVGSNHLALPENVWVAEIESGRTRHRPTTLRAAFVDRGSPAPDATGRSLRQLRALVQGGTRVREAFNQCQPSDSTEIARSSCRAEYCELKGTAIGGSLRNQKRSWKVGHESPGDFCVDHALRGGLDRTGGLLQRVHHRAGPEFGVPRLVRGEMGAVAAGALAVDLRFVLLYGGHHLGLPHVVYGLRHLRGRLGVRRRDAGRAPFRSAGWLRSHGRHTKTSGLSAAICAGR